MVLTVQSFAKLTLVLLGSVAMASPSLTPMAQDQDHSAHSGEAGQVTVTAAEAEASRTLFSQYGCGSCHVLAHANGYGSIGPAFDGNDALSVEHVNQIISEGQGAMPSFGGMVSKEEIETLSRYIVAKKAD